MCRGTEELKRNATVAADPSFYHGNGQGAVIIVLTCLSHSVSTLVIVLKVAKKRQVIVSYLKQQSGLPPLPRAKTLLTLSKVLLFIAFGSLAFYPSMYIELFLDLERTEFSDSVLILVYVTPVAMILSLMLPFLIFSAANDSKKFLKTVLLKCICQSNE